MECLDANVVQDLMSGALDTGTRVAVLGHLDTCADCRELLAVTARDTLEDGAPLAETVASVGPASVDDALAETLAPEAATRPRATTAKPAPGKRLGRYALGARLGAGAMGVVWSAEDPELGRKLAIKLLKRPDAALTERLVREARSMAQVSHPNVVAVYEVGVADGATYIAMELVQGTSLRAWQSSKHHTIPELIEAYVAAGRGLAAAHAAGLVHRDFKPDNVLVGDDGRVRVTDFGLAAVKPSESGTYAAIGDVNLTTDGSVLGTPAYMAPEQFGNGNVDSRTDQFNFCVALYEALYGERPFDGKTFEELGTAVCEGKIRPAPPGSAVSSALRAIILRGLAVKPGDRYPAMDHLLAELGRDRARPWRRTAIAAASLAAVLALGLVADYVVRARGLAQSSQAFAATGTQIARVGSAQLRRFVTVASFVRELKVMLDVTSHRDGTDFGLATPEQDAADLQTLHDILFAQDWRLVREQDVHATEIAVVDYKGRLLYTSASPNDWKAQLDKMPAIKRALDAGRGDFLTAIGYDEPAFAAAHLFGAAPPAGLVVMFARALEHGGEPGGVFLQFVAGRDVLDGIQLDDTELGLVAPGGRSVGAVPAALARAAPPSGEVAEARYGGKLYQVQARPLLDSEGQPFARVVMARPVPGVLSLFPHARIVFVLAALGALMLAGWAALRARQITAARV